MTTTTPHPTFVKLEYWDDAAQRWTTGHQGINLLYPERYPERLRANGKVGRVIVVDTGEIITASTDTVCPLCDEAHPAPHDGRCLL